MARTVTEIKDAIIKDVSANMPGLSGSTVAEWRLWAYIVAVAIHYFEIVMDLFRKEIDTLTAQITPGTVRWYAEMCKRFQNGDSLVFDEKTALLAYPVIDDAKRIIEVAAVSEGKDESNKLFIKVAKKNADGKIVELDTVEYNNLLAYIDAIKFAGCQTEIVNTKADQIYYDLTVYHDPAVANAVVCSGVEEALKNFKVSIDFDGVLYRQKMLDAVMAVKGVITCVLSDFKQHSYQSASDDDWRAIDTHAELDAGYFDWADGSVADVECRLAIKSINELLNAAGNEH